MPKPRSSANPTIVGLARIVNARNGQFSQGFEWRGFVGPHESMQLTVHPDKDGSYAIKSPDGTEWFSFDETTGAWGYRPDVPGQPGPWEKFDRDPHDATRLISRHDPSLDFFVLGPWPTLAPTLELPSLSIRGRDWYNREKLWVPRYCSMLSALRPDRTVEHWKAYLAWAVQTGFTGVRVFCGDLAWASGQTPASAAGRLPSFLETVASFGLACEVTAITGSGSGYDWRAYLREILQLCKGRPSVVVEAANEVGHGSQSSDLTFENILAVLRDPAWDSLTVAPGAPAWTDEPDETGHFAGRGGDYQTAHLDRGRDFWEQCRRVRELFASVEAEGIPCLDNEPLGADEIDGAESGKQRSNDPAFFACLGALDRAFQGVGGIHHSQAGLDVVMPGPRQTLCAVAYLEAHHAVEALLPGLTGRYYNSGHIDSPVGPYTDEDWAHVVRHYSFTNGSRGASVLIGRDDPDHPENHITIPWSAGWRPTNNGEPVIEWIREADRSRLQIFGIAR